MIKQLVQPIMALCLLGLFLSPATAQSSRKAGGELKVGDKAPDFEIETLDGKFKLSERFGDEGKPTILLFSRANW